MCCVNHWHVCSTPFRHGKSKPRPFWVSKLNFEYILILMKKMLCIAENSDEDQECGVHAVFPLIFPLPKRRRLVCLCLARQRLLHRSKLPHSVIDLVSRFPVESDVLNLRWPISGTECFRFCAGVSPVDPLHGLQEEVSSHDRRKRLRPHRGERWRRDAGEGWWGRW